MVGVHNLLVRHKIVMAKDQGLGVVRGRGDCINPYEREFICHLHHLVIGMIQPLIATTT